MNFMNKQKHQERLKTAVYISIMSFSFLLLTVSYYVENGYWYDLTINTGLSLLSVGILFFIVNKFFGLDAEDKHSKRFEYLLDILEKKSGLLFDKKTAFDQFNFDTMVHSAKEIDVVGYNLAEFFKEYYGTIAERVTQGAHVRVVIVDPSDTARDLFMCNSSLGDFDGHVTRTLYYFKYIRELANNSRKVAGSFEVRFTNWIPSYSMISVDRSSKSGNIKASIYSIHYRIPEHVADLNIVLERKEHPKWFDYFINQYEKIWEISEAWDGSIPNGLADKRSPPRGV